MTGSAAADLLPGYFIDPIAHGAWKTLPWPDTRESEDVLLEQSIGPGVIDWAESRLINPQTGEPWRFTQGQADFLMLWYWVGPDDRWIYRSGVKRGAKGTGKDPFAASMALIELMGPARLAGRDRAGRPVGARHGLPLVQIAANSEAQAKDVLRVANAMMPRSTREEYGYDAGETRSILSDGGRLELLTASEKTSEGDPATFIILNESHHMTESSGGHKLAAVARRNVGKSPAHIQARLVELTNAHQSGMDSVAERSFEAWQKQLANPKAKRDILYDSVEADPRTRIEDPDSLMLGIKQAYSDAEWADLPRIRDEAMDSRTSVGDTVRFYLNGLGVAEDAWVDPNNFDACARADMVVKPGEAIAVFLDCSKSDDATAMMGVRLSDLYNFTIGVWPKPHGARGDGWLVPRAEVDAKAREVLGTYDVRWFGADPSPAEDEEAGTNFWQPILDGLHRDFKSKIPNWASPDHALMYDMRRSARGGLDRLRAVTEMCMHIASLVDEEKPSPFMHDGNPLLRVHAHNARRRPNQFGIGIGKESRSSSKKIDAAWTMVAANVGARIALNSGKESKKAGVVW